jgi:hypothetical protein
LCAYSGAYWPMFLQMCLSLEKNGFPVEWRKEWICPSSLRTWPKVYRRSQLLPNKSVLIQPDVEMKVEHGC